MTTVRQRLRDMLAQIDLCIRHVPDRAALHDEVRQAAALRWLDVLGEAAANIPADVRERHLDVPWRDIVGMRNVLIHAYPDVRIDRVWGAMERLTGLRRQIEIILEELPE